MNYLIWLAGISVLVAGCESLWPARDQKKLRKWLWSDFFHLLFNGHFLGVMLYGIAFYHVLPVFDAMLAEQGWSGRLYRNSVGHWGLVSQSIVALIVLDFVQWVVHNTLHRLPFLWHIHKVHHSVKDGEMDWIVAFRFSWLEPVYYKIWMYVPIIWFGFAPEALFFHAVFGTLIGHLNHANLTWDYGPLRYLLNTPRMHLYHHDWNAPATGWNFGIIFSCWDWIFGTAQLPDVPPEKIGFPGVEELPNDFFGQIIWPFPVLLPALKRTNTVASLGGVGLIGVLHVASLPPTVSTPMFGEQAASSQPMTAEGAMKITHAANTAEAEAAAKRFGTAAKRAGWAFPEYAISAQELAEALGHEGLVILDVRKIERFTQGHIPSAQLVTRGDYSGGEIPGVSKDKKALEELLRDRGVNQDSLLVLMGDGGPEPYRFWWTLQEVAGVQSRVLNGGLAAWKNLGERLAEGPGVQVDRGTISVPGGPKRNLMWKELGPMLEKKSPPQLIDTRKKSEFDGVETHKKAGRPGRIPGAMHLPWTEVLELKDGAPVLKPIETIQEVLKGAGVNLDAPVVTYCQSGTRSSATYYALLQAGSAPENLWNYDGSWAEYSRIPEGDIQ